MKENKNAFIEFSSREVEEYITFLQKQLDACKTLMTSGKQSEGATFILYDSFRQSLETIY